MLDWIFVTFLNEKAISLFLQYEILETLVIFIYLPMDFHKLINLVLFLGVSLSRHRVQADAHERIQHLHDRRYVSLVETKNSFYKNK